MNYFGWKNSPASKSELRHTRTPGGEITDRMYRLATMLTEDGDILAIGEADVLDKTTGRLFHKAAQLTIPRSALLLPADALKVNPQNVNKKSLTRDLDEILSPYLCMLDKMVEGAVPVPEVAAPVLAAEVA